MTIAEAYERELDRGRQVIYVAADELCNVCRHVTELRAGACFECKELCATDMIEVWELADPTHRWPYVWCGKPREFSESVIQQGQKLAENLSKRSKRK